MRAIAVLGLALSMALPGCGKDGAPDPPRAMPRIDVVELDATEAIARLESGDITARQLTQAYLERIDAIDRAGPRLNSVIEVNPNALEDADRLDQERQQGRTRGPLHGLPILIKDNIEVVGMANSAGSLALAGNLPASDAFLVTRLRAAGALILGKTNLSEWANFRSTRSTSGWSSRGGQTKNPYALDRNPCGSSSGTGAAIAASLGAIGIGTETDGSIICPSAANGLVGLKPTVGLVSRNGIIPISITQDTAGPMARSVADAALLLGVIAAVDESDPAGHSAAGNIPSDYREFLKRDSLRGKRIGLLRASMGFHPQVDQIVERVAQVLRESGAEVVDARIENYAGWNSDEFEMLLYEFKDGLNRYLAARSIQPGSLQELIEFNRAHASTVMPFFGQELFEQAQAKGPVSEPGYLEARDRAKRQATEGLMRALTDQQLDALLAPSMSPAWLTDPVNGDHFTGAGYGIAAVAGTPSITIPAGHVQGLPIGVTFMGRAYSEPELLSLAYALEQILDARKPPEFLEQVTLSEHLP